MTEIRNPGRPSRYSDGLAGRICLRIAGGESLRRICDEEEMPDKATVLRWLLDSRHGAFRRRYGIARETQADAFADEIVDIADSAGDREDVTRAKLRIEARKWVAAKLKPKRYGDKLDVRGSFGFHHEDALLALEDGGGNARESLAGPEAGGESAAEDDGDE